MELDKTQIDELFSFVQSKYVGYVDCQYEIVDHLASAIEDEIIADPSLDFRQALDVVYSRFPVTGFSAFVRQKERALRSYWRSRMWTYIVGYFKFPRVILTLLLTLHVTMFCFYVPWGMRTMLVVVLLVYQVVGCLTVYRYWKINQMGKWGKMLATYTFQGVSAMFQLPALLLFVFKLFSDNTFVCY